VRHGRPRARLARGSQGKRLYTLVERVLFLQNVDLLADASTEDLSLLASIAEEVLYAASAPIYEQGQPADALYVVLRGRVALEKDGAMVLKLGETEALGAWTLFEAEPQVMTARADEETVLLRLDREEFLDLLLEYPELAQSILRALVRRMGKLLQKAGS